MQCNPYRYTISYATYLGIHKEMRRMEFEKLGRGIFEQQNQDFSQCEELWEPIDAAVVKKFVHSNHETLKMTRPGEDVSFLEWENVEKDLENGRVVELMMMFVRAETNVEKCPLCGSSITEDIGAISRRDNRTPICSVCGRNEAMDDYNGIRS